MANSKSILAQRISRIFFKRGDSGLELHCAVFLDRGFLPFLHDIDLAHEDGHATGSIDVAFLAEGSGSANVLTRKIDLRDDQLAEALKAGIVIDSPVHAEGSARSVRIVVLDQATGSAGSVRIGLNR